MDRLRTAPRAFYWCLLGLGLYLTVMKLTSGWRPEQFLGCGIMLFAFYWNDDTRRVGTGMVPLLITVVVYDLTHLTEHLVKDWHLHVHIDAPFLFDHTLFAIHEGPGVIAQLVATHHWAPDFVNALRTSGTLTPNVFFALHHSAPVDFVTGSAYILFLYCSLAFPVALCIPRHRPDLVRLALQFGWVFMAVNIIGYITYYIYPAAPPWYLEHHGFHANFSVMASPAAAIRWDRLTGIHYFQAFYGRSADVFGAIPSLHVADPLMVFLYGRFLRKRWFNIASFSFYLLMCFSAIYLQHHYVLDVALGSSYALIAYAVQQLISAKLRARSHSTRPAEPAPLG